MAWEVFIFVPNYLFCAFFTLSAEHLNLLKLNILNFFYPVNPCAIFDQSACNTRL